MLNRIKNSTTCGKLKFLICIIILSLGLQSCTNKSKETSPESPSDTELLSLFDADLLSKKENASSELLKNLASDSIDEKVKFLLENCTEEFTKLMYPYPGYSYNELYIDGINEYQGLSILIRGKFQESETKFDDDAYAFQTTSYPECNISLSKSAQDIEEGTMRSGILPYEIAKNLKEHLSTNEELINEANKHNLKLIDPRIWKETESTIYAEFMFYKTATKGSIRTDSYLEGTVNMLNGEITTEDYRETTQNINAQEY